MDDGTMFTVIGWLLGAYVLTCVVQFTCWFLRLWTDADDEPHTMECPACGELEFTFVGHITPRAHEGVPFDEYECVDCHHYGTF